MTLRTFKNRKQICTYIPFPYSKGLHNKHGLVYVRLSTNFYIHHVRLSRNLYVRYVRLSTSFKKTKVESIECQVCTGEDTPTLPRAILASHVCNFFYSFYQTIASLIFHSNEPTEGWLIGIWFEGRLIPLNSNWLSLHLPLLLLLLASLATQNLVV